MFDAGVVLVGSAKSSSLESNGVDVFRRRLPAVVSSAETFVRFRSAEEDPAVLVLLIVLVLEPGAMVVLEEDPKRRWKLEDAVVGPASKNRLSSMPVGDAVVLVCSALEESAVVSSSEELESVVLEGSGESVDIITPSRIPVTLGADC